MVLSRYEKFVLLLQTNNLCKAKQIVNGDKILNTALLLLTSDYNYYKKDTN